ncbi:LysR family transcriptional regulator [Desulfosporosinus sp. OT]|uniref:LysR family transcriptional regulator n=1 Tax=Desulfosporosinus sp. OT TaxID=913865 RepID=UPI000223B23B|nr:LysR family transcriptional regulator [Desulfosporosinus sp. OT]EGW38795.1 bacterial regulatory helix-turn-helix, lysR family protein [Desulfosporosinus sp. OT]
MEYRNLISFRKIVELQSFSKAAEALGYAQSTVTTQMKQLEEELGIRLFDRIGNRIALTNAGTTFLNYTNQIISLTDRAKEALIEDNLPSGILKIAGINSLCVSLLPEIIKGYSEEYREVKLETTTGAIKDVLTCVRNGNADFALYMDFEGPTEEFVTVYKEENPLLFLCAPDNTLRKKKNLMLKDLKETNFIVTEHNCSYRKKLMQLLGQNNIEPNIYLETGNTEIIKKFVETDIGITMLPELSVREEMQEQKLMKLEITEQLPKTNIYVVYHKNKWVTSAMREFIKYLDIHFGKTPSY